MSEGLGGNMSNGMMIGSSGNTNMLNSQSNMMNPQNSTTNNLFANSSNNMQRNNGWPGMNSSNTGNVNPFQPQNTLSNNNALPSFGGSSRFLLFPLLIFSKGMNNSTNNLFNPNNNTGNNLFGNNQQGGGSQGFFNNNQPNNPFQNTVLLESFSPFNPSPIEYFNE